jgi:hypothetical protein
MGTLEDIALLYNYSNGTIIEDTLKRYLQIFKDNYGHHLEELVTSMLKVKKEDRPSLS